VSSEFTSVGVEGCTDNYKKYVEKREKVEVLKEVSFFNIEKQLSLWLPFLLLTCYFCCFHFFVQALKAKRIKRELMTRLAYETGAPVGTVSPVYPTPLRRATSLPLAAAGEDLGGVGADVFTPGVSVAKKLLFDPFRPRDYVGAEFGYRVERPGN
jgi:hypothetical protein